MLGTEQLDAAALALISHDVLILDDADMIRPTPYDGWTVADLISHMNDEHEKITRPVLGADEPRAVDPRQQFAVSAARWVLAWTRRRAEVMVPSVGRAAAVEQVRSVHFIDMLTHRWDLAKALGRTCPVDARLTDAALPIASAVTSAGSPLLGTAYQPSRGETFTSSSIDRLAAVLGRDPDWTPRAKETPLRR